jgi:lysophospholipase L1-like esterase
VHSPALDRSIASFKSRRLVVPVALALAVSGCGDAKRQTAKRCPSSHWVSAWTASPTYPSNSGFAGQTLRMIVVPHLGGDRLRVRLSNRSGRRAVTFDAVTVGLRDDRAGVVPGSMRSVTFGGRRSVTLPPREDVVASDAVALRVTPFRALAVSIRVTHPTGPATEHRYALQTSFVTRPGTPDATRDTSGRPFSVASGAWSFLTGVDVRAPGEAGAVVALGDSITEGFQDRPGGGVDRGEAYPDFLARRLVASTRATPLSVVNAGIGGNQLLAAHEAPSILKRLASDVLGQPGVSSVIVLAGINDIARPPYPRAPALINGLVEIVNALHSRGLRVLLGTIPPAGPYGERAGVRRGVNRWIRTSGSADAVADFDAVLRSGQDSDHLAARFDSGDGVHPNTAGYAAMARAVNLSDLAGPGCR